MKKEIVILCYFITVLLISCKSPSTKEDMTNLDIAKPDPVKTKPESISLISLIAASEKYDQKLIRVKGYLNLMFEGNAIYLSKEDCDLGIDKNGLWIDVETIKVDSKKYNRSNKQYVILEGIFQSDNKGHQNGYSGSITKIIKIEPLNNRLDLL
ncbi:hypothetical protein [Pedobacter immunditicola]|uniref:hypothetical protein n=1 Tax=Pedobacter immunditicola TaxID=3133440 RepID=UPI0030AE93BC